MAFEYAGNLGGAGAPVIRRFQVDETMYVGQLVQTGMFGNSAGGHVKIADVATEAFEDDQPILGFISAVADGSRTFVTGLAGTQGYGDRSTYTVDRATVAANAGSSKTGGGEVDVTLALPMKTLIKAPLYDATWGTALTEIVEQDGDATGVVITSAAATADIANNFGTIYCRSGANRGQYRVIVSVVAAVTTVTVPFPYAISVGDTFVQASCVLGYGGMDVTTGADAIDGDNDMNFYHSVYYHEINLEEAGKEYAVFAFWPQSVESVA
jgi:hypothetical protein